MPLPEVLFPAFNFHVRFHHVPGLPDQVFQEVGGLSWDLETEELPAGGVNDFTIRLPKHLKFPNLTLKRAMSSDATLSNWMEKSIQNYFVSPPSGKSRQEGVTDLTITLLNSGGDALAEWRVQEAFPVKWNITPFNAMESKLVMETLEFTYRSFKRN